ncbi:DNA protection during starvation protein [Mycobacterium xenopi 3993]|nr:DNA protection during starvation protein [Mycobacterium xenopi 3993]
MQAHLAALDLVYTGVIEDVRKGIDETEELDRVTQDILIDQAAELEKFQWFVRAHLENAGGSWPTKDPRPNVTPRARRGGRVRNRPSHRQGFAGARGDSVICGTI